MSEMGMTSKQIEAQMAELTAKMEQAKAEEAKAEAPVSEQNLSESAEMLRLVRESHAMLSTLVNAGGVKETASSQVSGGSDVERVSVEGLNLGLESYAGAFASWAPNDNEEFGIISPDNLVSAPLASVTNDRGTWAVIPVKSKAGKESVVAVLAEVYGGKVGRPFESTLHNGLTARRYDTWANVSGWEKSDSIKVREQASASAPAPKPAIEEPF